MYWVKNDNYLICKNKKSIDIDKSLPCAMFDLDETIITTLSGKKFAKDDKDWKMLYDNTKTKLKDISKTHNIVIISNQAGLNKKDKIEMWKNKINNIITYMNLNIFVFASIKNDDYRKPRTRFMTDFFNYLYNDDNDSLLKDSYYCGDACGRKYDFSDTDYKFALNSGLKCILPEKLFQNINLKPEKSNLKYIDLNSIPKKNYEPFNKLCKEKNKKILVLMCGFPASGKSYYSTKYLKDFSYINQDTLKTANKCLKECTKNMSKGLNIVIDNTNTTLESRAKYIDLANKHNYYVVCLRMTTSHDLAMHNNYFRGHLTGKYISSIVYNMFKKKFIEPSCDEGINEIIKIDFCLEGNDDKLLNKWNKYYY